jgi:hypothetical protein
MDDPCCPDDLNYLLLQINVICLQLALVGSTVVIRHPTWFGAEPLAAIQPLIER